MGVHAVQRMAAAAAACAALALWAAPASASAVSAQRDDTVRRWLSRTVTYRDRSPYPRAVTRAVAIWNRTGVVRLVRAPAGEVENVTVTAARGATE